MSTHNVDAPEEERYECLICGAGGNAHMYFCSKECWRVFEDAMTNKRLMFAELKWSCGGPDGPSRHLIEKPEPPTPS